MTKKTLAETARELLGENLRPADSKASGEPRGAGVAGTKITEPSDGSETVVPDQTSLDASGIGAAAHSTSKVAKRPADKASAQDPMNLKTPGEVTKVTAEEEDISEEDAVTEEKDDDKKDKEDKKEDGDKDDDDDSDDDDEKKDTKNEEAEDVALTPATSVADKVKSYFKGKGAGLAVEEDMKALFKGEKLSENFMAKAKLIFETAVMARSIEVCEAMEAEAAEILESYAEKVKTDLTEKVDDYLNYMVEEWVKENEIAIEKGIRAELAEDFIGGLRNLFIEHYIDIPEDKVNVVEELAGKVEDLEGKLNEEIERGVAQNKVITDYKKKILVSEALEGLTDTQKQKLLSLTENVEWTDEKGFKEAIQTLKDNYFTGTGTPAIEPKKQLDEESAEGDPMGVKEEEIDGDPEMELYTKAISKSLSFSKK